VPTSFSYTKKKENTDAGIFDMVSKECRIESENISIDGDDCDFDRYSQRQILKKCVYFIGISESEQDTIINLAQANLNSDYHDIYITIKQVKEIANLCEYDLYIKGIDNNNIIQEICTDVKVYSFDNLIYTSKGYQNEIQTTTYEGPVEVEFVLPEDYEKEYNDYHFGLDWMRNEYIGTNGILEYAAINGKMVPDASKQSYLIGQYETLMIGDNTYYVPWLMMHSKLNYELPTNRACLSFKLSAPDNISNKAVIIFEASNDRIKIELENPISSGSLKIGVEAARKLKNCRIEIRLEELGQGASNPNNEPLYITAYYEDGNTKTVCGKLNIYELQEPVTKNVRLVKTHFNGVLKKYEEWTFDFDKNRATGYAFNEEINQWEDKWAEEIKKETRLSSIRKLLLRGNRYIENISEENWTLDWSRETPEIEELKELIKATYSPPSDPGKAKKHELYVDPNFTSKIRDLYKKYEYRKKHKTEYTGTDPLPDPENEIICFCFPVTIFECELDSSGNLKMEDGKPQLLPADMSALLNLPYIFASGDLRASLGKDEHHLVSLFAHEYLHCEGLIHSFYEEGDSLPNDVQLFFYEKFLTDNLMDYYYYENGGVKKASLWKWQVEYINNANK
jgi:hypothetical protein